MAKVTIKFDLNDPESKQTLSRMLKSSEMATVLWEVVFNLRKNMENKVDPKGDKGVEELQGYMDGVNDTLEAISDLMDESGLIIEDLTN